MTHPLPVKKTDQIQIEIVDEDGKTSIQKPVNIDEILKQEDHTLDIGHNIRLRVEEFNPDEDYEDDNIEESEDSSDSSTFDGDHLSTDPPPGTQAGGWYEVLNALRKEHDETVREEKRKNIQGGMLIKHLSTATPLKKFTRQEEVENKSLDTQMVEEGLKLAASASEKSRHEVWSSLSPPPPVPERDYQHLQYVSAHPISIRHFRPPALTFHAMTSYISAKDKCRRILVYGGVGIAGKAVEQELYEYSLLTLNWRRVEGKQFVPAGHYGHAMTIVEPLDKLVLIGGIGPGGILSVDKTVMEDPLRAARSNYLLPVGCRTNQSAERQLSNGYPTTRENNTATGIGFVPYLFDMTLSTQAWRAVQTSVVFPLVYHTAVSFGTQVYVFGGLSETLEVQDNLIVVNVEDYSVRRVLPRGKEEKPCGRFLHSAVRFGLYMIIYGGLNEKNEVLNDAWAFDMVNSRWEKLPFSAEVGGRAGHAAVVVGSRMLIYGGFDTSLEETNISNPLSAVAEINLVPTTKGEHVYKESIRIKPKLPPVAFSTAAPCGDDASFFSFGGLAAVVKKKTKDAKKSRSRSITKEKSANHEEEEDDNDENKSSGDVLLQKYLLFDDCLVVSFKQKVTKKSAEEDEDEPQVNELGIEIDPDELPEHFKAFVRRQEDFVMKKHVAETTAIKKIELEEKEGMEPTLYLTEDEIKRLMEKSEQCCDSFLNDYKMDSLPSNVPDRETRVHIIEECISLSRQVRDVMKSMKGSEAGVTAVKSKSHRMRTGKFEDYSAAKPFRRAMIHNLITNINHQLAHMHQLNKLLRTVDWEEKEQFTDAVQKMQNTVNDLVRAINAVMSKYIKNRVESLMKGVDKHNEVMRQLREVVEKNRHDKIWGKDEENDKQRQRVKKEWKKGEEAENQKQHPSQKAPARAASAQPKRHAPRHRSQSIGAGFYKEEANVSVKVLSNEWDYYLQQVKRIEHTATALQQHCEAGKASGAQSTFAPSQPLVQQAAPPQQTSPPPPAVQVFPPPPSLPGQPPAMPLPGQPPVSQPPLDTPLQRAVHPELFPLPGAPTTQSPPPPVAANTLGGEDIGSASPKEIMIRHSNELRDKVIEFAADIADGAEHLSRELQGVQPEEVKTKKSTKQPAPVTPPPPPAAEPGLFPQNPPATGLDAKAKEEEGVKRLYSLRLPLLRPLGRMKDDAEKLIPKVALIRVNEWDGNDLGGAPQDAKAVKLHNQLTKQISSLFQRMSASFLTVAGMRKKGASHTRDPSAQRKKTRAKSAVVVGERQEKPAADRPYSFGGAETRSSSSSSDNAPPRVAAPTLNAALGGGSQPPAVSRGVTSLPPSAPGASAGSKTSSSSKKTTAGAPRLKAEVNQKPKSKSLAPVPYSLNSHSVQLGTLPSGIEEDAPKTNKQAVPLISMDVFQIPTTVEPSSSGAVRQPSAEVAPAGVGEVKTVSNPPTTPVPFWGAPAVRPADQPGAKPVYANEWSVANPQKVAQYEQASGVPKGTPTPADPSQKKDDTVQVGAIAVATGAGMVHIPVGPKEEPPATTTDEDKPRRSTILALTQMSSGKEMEDHRTTATSVAPGAFLVNQDYFEERVPPVAESAQANKGKASWADAEEDYFYFGKQQVEEPATSIPAEKPSSGEQSTSPRTVVRQYPAYTVSPPIGSTLASQNVNAQKKRTPSAKKASSKTSSAPTSLTTHRQTISSQSKMRPPGTAREIEKSHLTPGERKILEARERLSRKVK